MYWDWNYTSTCLCTAQRVQLFITSPYKQLFLWIKISHLLSSKFSILLKLGAISDEKTPSKISASLESLLSPPSGDFSSELKLSNAEVTESGDDLDWPSCAVDALSALGGVLLLRFFKLRCSFCFFAFILLFWNQILTWTKLLIVITLKLVVLKVSIKLPHFIKSIYDEYVAWCWCK